MRKIIILGNSVAGVRAAEEIRQKDNASSISIFCENQYLPYQEHLLADYLAKDIREDKLYYRPKNFYQEKSIQLIFDKKIL